VRIRIGSRGSALARWQAEHVRARLAALGHEVTVETIVTTGDRVLDPRLMSVGGKGAFLKEIEEALLAREVDLAVHSLKDVPVLLPRGLRLAALLPREDPRDALLSKSGQTLAELPRGARVGTTSLRRRAQLLSLRPDLALQPLRGNVDTRIRKLERGECEAIVVALAGLRRLGRSGEVTEVLEPERLLPAPGQGAIALECREGDGATLAAVSPLDDPPTARCVSAERSFLSALGGGCNVPLGALGVEAGGQVRLRVLVAGEDGTPLLRAEGVSPDPEALGRALADELRAKGAGALLLG
jgi:hydroxymethylbilane synthase